MDGDRSISIGDKSRLEMPHTEPVRAAPAPHFIRVYTYV